jgi:glycosyltransferase involved in cell wall biosynthesis
VTEEPRRILFITFDLIGPRIGGSAIRVLGLARALAERGHFPMVAAPRVKEGYPEQPFPIRTFETMRPAEKLRPLLEAADCVVLPLHGLARLPLLRDAKIPLVFDIYDPIVFELMETAPAEVSGHFDLLERVLRRGDFFLCASERQRDFWLGALAGVGRLTSGGAEMRGLIDVVPFGIDPTPIATARPGRPVLKAVIPTLATAEKVIVWPGGIWDWTDPEILMRAMRILGQRAPGLHLVFFAGRHPSDGQTDSGAARKARSLADEFGLRGRTVHFIDDYVPYAERGRYLAECDAAVSTHRANLESHFAYRTRLLDCIWAGLPIVCTAGDVFAELVVRHEWGIVVAAGDAESLAHALERVARDDEFAANCRARMAESRHLFNWSDAVEPLARFCRQPRVTHAVSSVSDFGMLTKTAWGVFKTKGPAETARRLKQYWQSR